MANAIKSICISFDKKLVFGGLFYINAAVVHVPLVKDQKTFNVRLCLQNATHKKKMLTSEGKRVTYHKDYNRFYR